MGAGLNVHLEVEFELRLSKAAVKVLVLLAKFDPEHVVNALEGLTRDFRANRDGLVELVNLGRKDLPSCIKDLEDIEKLIGTRYVSTEKLPR